MKAFDARCESCGGVHIIWVGWHQEVGDTIRIRHDGCLEVTDHTLVGRLDGLSDHEKWGSDA